MTSTRVRAVFSLVAYAVLAGCGVPAPPAWQGTQLDQWGWFACTDLGEEIQSAGGAPGAYALRPEARQRVATAYAETAGRSTTPLAKDSAAVLNRTVDASTSAWTLALDTAAGRCLQLGWDPNRPAG